MSEQEEVTDPVIHFDAVLVAPPAVGNTVGTYVPAVAAASQGVLPALVISLISMARLLAFFLGEVWSPFRTYPVPLVVV